MVETEKLKTITDKDGKPKSSSDSFNKALAKAGYEFANSTDADDAVDEFYDSICELNGKDGCAIGAAGVAAEIDFGGIDILDFISSWNTKMMDKEGSQRIFEHIETHIGTIDDEELEETSYSQIINPLIDALIDKSESFNKKALDSNSYRKLEEARKALKEEQENSKSSISGGLAEAFDRLYVLTRKAAMAEFRYNVIQSYGSIDDDIFNEELFVDEVDADLKEEGIDITDSNMTVRRRRKDTPSGTSTKKTSEPDDTEKPEDDGDRDSRTSTNIEKAQEIDEYYNSTDSKETQDDWNKGEELAELLGGLTSTTDQNKITTIIEEDMNATNVFTILAGYEDNDAWIKNPLMQLFKEDNFADKDTLIKQILKYAKENLEAQKKVEQSKSDKNSNKITRLNRHIKEINSIINSTLTEDLVKKADALLETYSTNVENNVDSGGFCDFWGSIWNGTLGLLF